MLFINTVGMITPGIAIFIGVVALIIFGPKKLPEFGRAMGTSLKEFKDATDGIMKEHDKDDKTDIRK